MKLEVMVSFMPNAMCFKGKADLESVLSMEGKKPHVISTQI